MNNPLRARWADDAPAYNAWLHINSAWSAEVLAHVGYDSLTVDLQHGPLDFGDALHMLRAVHTVPGAAALVRVGWNDPAAIMRALDAGALGVICPMVNSAAEAAAFAAACRYAPDGTRSRGPTRAEAVYGKGYLAAANEQVVALAMVETRAALNALDAILATPGLDGVYVGPGDLSLSLYGMARSGLDIADADFMEVLASIARACRAAGKIAGVHTNSPRYAHRMAALGYRFITCMTDTVMLRTIATHTVAALRGEPEHAEHPSEQQY